MTDRLLHTGRLRRWTSPKGSAAWHFVTIDGDAGEALTGTALMRKLEGTRGGFGSIKVTAGIGGSTFATSVFPSKDAGWLLPVKAGVRRSEGIAEGDMIALTLDY